MTERRYTLAEIDAMRKALRDRLFSKFWEHRSSASGDYETTLHADAERQLRTAMLGGVDPAEFTNRTGNSANDKTEN